MTGCQSTRARLQGNTNRKEQRHHRKTARNKVSSDVQQEGREKESKGMWQKPIARRTIRQDRRKTDTTGQKKGQKRKDGKGRPDKRKKGKEIRAARINSKKDRLKEGKRRQQRKKARMDSTCS